jgi:hypothetical protein
MLKKPSTLHFRSIEIWGVKNWGKEEAKGRSRI